MLVKQIFKWPKSFENLLFIVENEKGEIRQGKCFHFKKNRYCLYNPPTVHFKKTTVITYFIDS